MRASFAERALLITRHAPQCGRPEEGCALPTCSRRSRIEGLRLDLRWDGAQPVRGVCAPRRGVADLSEQS